MRVSFYFERGCPEQRPRAALKPQEPHSSGAWTPGAPAEVLAGRGVVVVESWQVASCMSYLCSREGGPHTSPTPETSYYTPHLAICNVNPQGGAQDIAKWFNEEGANYWCPLDRVNGTSVAMKRIPSLV
jgi:hypothetical protein